MTNDQEFIMAGDSYECEMQSFDTGRPKAQKIRRAVYNEETPQMPFRFLRNIHFFIS